MSCDTLQTRGNPSPTRPSLKGRRLIFHPAMYVPTYTAEQDADHDAQRAVLAASLTASYAASLEIPFTGTKGVWLVQLRPAPCVASFSSTRRVHTPSLCSTRAPFVRGDGGSSPVWGAKVKRSYEHLRGAISKAPIPTAYLTTREPSLFDARARPSCAHGPARLTFLRHTPVPADP